MSNSTPRRGLRRPFNWATFCPDVGHSVVNECAIAERLIYDYDDSANLVDDVDYDDTRYNDHNVVAVNHDNVNHDNVNHAAQGYESSLA